MGQKTSVYLPDDLAAAVRASGVNLAELIRRGLGADAPDVTLARLAAQETAGAMLADMRETVREAVRSALRDAQGGSW